MTADRAALVERVAMAIAASEKFDWYDEEIADFRNSFRRNATAAIALIRAEVLEEAAVDMERLNIFNAAAAIRALKETKNG